MNAENARGYGTAGDETKASLNMQALKLNKLVLLLPSHYFIAVSLVGIDNYRLQMLCRLTNPVLKLSKRPQISQLIRCEVSVDVKVQTNSSCHNDKRDLGRHVQ